MTSRTFDIGVGDFSALRAGRHALESGLRLWGCGNFGDVILVFSELVTNATVHSRGATTAVIAHEPPYVRLAVHDISHAVPELRHGDETGGFGLRIVTEVSDCWGWEQTATGKAVWCVTRCGH